MKIFYGGLSALMLIASILFFFITIWVYKVLLFELVVSLDSFIFSGVLTAVFLASAHLCYTFYALYEEQTYN